MYKISHRFAQCTQQFVSLLTFLPKNEIIINVDLLCNQYQINGFFLGTQIKFWFAINDIFSIFWKKKQVQVQDFAKTMSSFGSWHNQAEWCERNKFKVQGAFRCSMFKYLFFYILETLFLFFLAFSWTSAIDKIVHGTSINRRFLCCFTNLHLHTVTFNGLGSIWDPYALEI